MNKKDLKYLWLIFFIVLVIISLSINSKFYFGDSINYYIEERILFFIRHAIWKSNTILPSMINGIGVYNYLEYGLLYIINSLEFNTNDYEIILSIVSLLMGIVLLYYFLNITNNKKISIITSILYILFINKMLIDIHSSVYIYIIFPYILLAFIGAYKRYKYNTIITLSIGIFLVCIINYKYLIPLLIVILLYGVYLYLENNKIINIKKFIKYQMVYLVPILIGILLSSIVLLPVVYYRGIDFTINLDFRNINIILIFSLVYCLLSNRRNRYLSIATIILSLFYKDYYLCYIVLECMVVCTFINGILNKNINYLFIVMSNILSIIYIIISKDYYLSIELFIINMGLFIYMDYSKKIYFIMPLCLYMVIYGIYTNINNVYIREGLFLVYSNDFINNKYIKEYSDKYILEGNSLYQIISSYYNNDNSIEDMNNNENSMLPLGFASRDIISYEDYEKLNSLQKEEVLLSNIVVDKSSHNEYVSNIKEIKIDQDRYYIKTNDIFKYTYHLGDNINNSTVLVEFLCKKCNGSIKINHIREDVENNKIYRYTISDVDVSNIYINLCKGEYDIRNIKIYILDNANIENNRLTLDEMVVTKDSSNIIEGNIKVSGDGYFLLTIPYEKYYNLYIDGNKTKYELVDGMFIGTSITKGEHIIKIEKDDKFIFLALFLSYIGLMFMLFINYFENRRKFV